MIQENNIIKFPIQDFANFQERIEDLYKQIEIINEYHDEDLIIFLRNIVCSIEALHIIFEEEAKKTIDK